MRTAYLGPEGTFSHEALLAEPEPGEPAAYASLHLAVVAVQAGEADRAFVPLENSVEGAVNPTLDALAFDAPDLVITGEAVREVRHALLAAPGTALTDVTAVRSHPQALAQAAGWLRTHLPQAAVSPTTSTAEAVREAVAAPGVAAVAAASAGERYGAVVLADHVEDQPGNATRFVWLARAGDAPATPARGVPTKSTVLFHGQGDRSPGWLVRCLSEFAFRGVNLTRIESRPLRSRLGHYLFHVDLDGGTQDPQVVDALASLRAHCEEVRLLGSYAAARRAP